MIHGTDHFKPMLRTFKHDHVALDIIPRSLVLNYDIILYSGDGSTMYRCNIVLVRDRIVLGVGNAQTFNKGSLH